MTDLTYSGGNEADFDPPFCIGHSHLRCVQQAAAEAGTALQSLNFWDRPDDVVKGETWTLVPQLQQALREHPGSVVSWIGGGAHTVIGLVSHPRRFDFVLPESPDLPLDPRAELVPSGAVRDSLMVQTAPYLQLMGHVRTLARKRMLHMEPPPPCRDNAQIDPHIPWPLFPDMLQEVAPPWLRYKMWRLHSRLVREFCAQADIEFVACPEAGVDAEGFLTQDSFFDGIHANSHYGALQLQQMRERL